MGLIGPYNLCFNILHGFQSIDVETILRNKFKL